MKLHLGESNHTLMAGPVAPVDPVDPVDPPVAAPVELLPVAPVDVSSSSHYFLSVNGSMIVGTLC